VRSICDSATPRPSTSPTREHVRSPVLPVRAVQRALDPLAVRFEADHLVRDPLDYLADEGFEIESVERSKWGIVERVRASRPG
jgi:hypothetical protein